MIGSGACFDWSGEDCSKTSWKKKTYARNEQCLLFPRCFLHDFTRVSLYVSVLTLTFISIERYLAICHPLQHHTNSVKSKLSIVTVWIISLLTPFYDFINSHQVHHEEVPDSLLPWFTECKVKDSKVERDFQIFDMTAFYFIPLCVMTFAYTKIARCLWTSALTNNAVTHNLQHEHEQLRARKRTAKMLIVVVITFGLCYLPINIVNIIRYTGALDTLEDPGHYILFQLIRFLFYFNSAINPVIYNFMSAKFRKQFKSACFRCYSCCSRQPIDSSDNRSSHSFYSRTNNVRLTLMSRHNSGSNS